MRSVSKFIKEARVENGLTQKQFAERFFITKKAVSNYENGIRTPDLEFLINLCREFNLSLDRLVEQQKDKSKYENLVVAERNGKKGIYDRKQDVCLTTYSYDDVRLSKCGYHIVKKRKRNIGLNTYGISFVIDNWGKKIYFRDLLVDISNGKEYLITIRGEKISEGYNRISSAVDDVSYGLYSAIKTDNFKERVLVNSNGEELACKVELTPSYLYREKIQNREKPCKLLENVEEILNLIENYGLDAELIEKIPTNIYKENAQKFEEAQRKYLKSYNEKIAEMEGYRMFYIPEIDTLDKAVNMITTYGFDIVSYLPKNIFAEKANYIKIIHTLLNYMMDYIYKRQSAAIDGLARAMQTLVKYANMWGLKGEISEDERNKLKSRIDEVEEELYYPNIRIEFLDIIKSTLKGLDIEI